MPVIRRGGTYLDVSTTPHTPEGRLKFDRLRAGCNISYKKAVCTTLLFICDEHRDHRAGSTEALSVSMVDLRMIMRSRAEAANVKLGPCKDIKLQPALTDLYLHRHVDLTFTEDGNEKSGIQHIDIRPSFQEIYEGFQEVLDRCGLLSPRTKYRAYMSLAVKVFGSNRAPTLLQAVKCAVDFSKRYEDLEQSSLDGGSTSMEEVFREEHGDDITQHSREYFPSVIHVDAPMGEDDDTSVEPMWADDVETGDDSRQVVPVTPIRLLSRNYSNCDIGLPTPESLPRGNIAVSTSRASPTAITPSRNDDGGHSDSHNPQASASRFEYISLGVGAIVGFVSGIIQGYEWSSSVLLPEISSLHTEVVNLHTTLAATEEALEKANMATTQSQRQCFNLLRDLKNAHSRIESLEACATEDVAEKCDLRQEVTDLQSEVSRLQNGVEQIKRIAGVLIPGLSVV